MTRAGQKADEQSSLLHFLERWGQGTEWELVEETTNTENPDFLLQRVDGLETVGVEMRGSSALAIGSGRKRRAAIRRIAKLISERLPIEESTKIDLEELSASEIHAVDCIVVFPQDELDVINAGASADGVGVHVVQPYIDDVKLANLEARHAEPSTHDALAKLVRDAAGFVFQDYPEVRKEATSSYLRRQRAASRSRASKPEETAKSTAES